MSMSLKTNRKTKITLKKKFNKTKYHYKFVKTSKKLKTKMDHFF
jgi:hypothetical protein